MGRNSGLFTDNKRQSMVTFVRKNIFTCFRVSRAILSDHGVHLKMFNFGHCWLDMVSSSTVVLLIIIRLVVKLRCPIRRLNKS